MKKIIILLLLILFSHSFSKKNTTLADKSKFEDTYYCLISDHVLNTTIEKITSVSIYSKKMSQFPYLKHWAIVV